MSKQALKRLDPVGWPDYTYPITIKGQTLNVAVDLVAQTIGTVKVEIAAQTVTLNVNISSVSSGVTFNVNVASSVDINVKTSSGANIVIDKLVDSAHNARQEVFIQNHGTTPTLVTSDPTIARGKLFARGMRGHPMAIYVYTKNTDSVNHTLTVKVAPFVGFAPVWTGTITVPAGFGPDWISVTFRRPWLYDSMFIWVKTDSASGIYLAQNIASYDKADAFDSSDEVFWSEAEYNWWIKVYQAGETVGDLPVTGTVSTVNLPVQSSGASGGTVLVPAGGTATALEVKGCGVVENLVLYSNYCNMYVRIYCDDQLQLIDPLLVAHDTLQFNNWQAAVSSVGVGVNVILSKYDTTNNRYCFQLNIKFQFRRNFKVVFYNPDSVDHSAVAAAVVNLLQ